MLIREIDFHAGDSERAAMAHIEVDGKREYMIIGGRGSVTILTGRWIRDRRALGKTFWNLQEIQDHYKRDGAVIIEYSARVAHFN